MKKSSLLVLLFALAIASTVQAGVLGKTTQGKPALKRIDALEFGPDGVLFLGDGAGAQIFAVQTKEKAGAPKLPAKLSGINARLAEKLGAKADGIEILDFAVNPSSGVAYFAIRKQDDKSYLVMTLQGEEMGCSILRTRSTPASRFPPVKALQSPRSPISPGRMTGSSPAPPPTRNSPRRFS